MSAHVDLGQQVFDNISSQIVFAILSTQPDQRSSTLCMKTEGDSIILYPFYGFSELRIKVAPQNITIHLVNKNLCGPSTSKLILTGQITGSADEPKIYVDHIDLAHLSGEYRFIFKAIDSSFGGVLRKAAHFQSTQLRQSLNEFEVFWGIER